MTAARLAFVAAIAIARSAEAAPPPGHSAYLNGMHDIEALGFMTDASPGCDKGWITDLQYIGMSGQASGSCRDEATSVGVSVIVRLDASPSQSFPHDAAQAGGYGAAFADFVDDCDDVHVWIVGNEPNITMGASDPDCTANAYAEAYVAAHQAVHALPGHGDDVLLVSPNSPFSPGCLQSLRMIIDAIEARGVTPDGFSLHPYTRAPNAGAVGPGYIDDEATQADATIDECPGPANWNDTWHRHFQIYRDYIAIIEAHGLGGKPVFLTETGNACDPVAGNDCYPDADLGYFAALYQEVADWNASAATKIRAVTPYRWTLHDDGTGRDFEIGARPQLLADLENAFAAGHTWTEPGCEAEGPCVDDAQCEGQTICELASGTCVPTQPCGAGGVCAAGQLCRVPQGDCVPELRGDAGLSVVPAVVDPFAMVSLDASSTIGYTNIGMRLVGPAGDVVTSLTDITEIGGVFHWWYGATLDDAGTYRATFVADPGASTLYAIRYFNAGMPEFPEGTSGASEESGTTGSESGDEGPSEATTSGDAPPLTGAAPWGTGSDAGCGCRSSRDGGVWLLLIVLWGIRAESRLRPRGSMSARRSLGSMQQGRRRLLAQRLRHAHRDHESRCEGEHGDDPQRCGESEHVRRHACDEGPDRIPEIAP
jgi:hypothetical protein